MTYNLQASYPDVSVLTTSDKAISVMYGRVPITGELVPLLVDGTGALATSEGSSPYSTNLRTINAQTSSTYTFALTDGSGNGNNPLVTFGSSSATMVTIPLNASVAFPVGSQIECIQIGTGKVTFEGAGGVTINSQAGNLSIAAQWVGVSLIQTSTDNWILVGNLIA